jgi:VCBS repeat protein
VGTTADGKNFAVIMGRGDGGFGVAVVTSYALGLATAVADLNGDGKQDVIAGDALLAGNGDGTFRFPVFVGVVAEYCDKTLPGSSNYPCWHSTQAAAVADFNGDGLPDIAAGYIAVQPLMHREYAAVSVLLNDGPGDGFYATGVSSATRMWPVAPGSLVSAFGVNLASTTESSHDKPASHHPGGDPAARAREKPPK